MESLGKSSDGMTFALGTRVSHNRPTRDGRAVTVNLNECVMVTTGTLVITSVTDNRHNFCTVELDLTYGPTRSTRKRARRLSVERQPEIFSTTSECHIIYTFTFYALHMLSQT